MALPTKATPHDTGGASFAPESEAAHGDEASSTRLRSPRDRVEQRLGSNGVTAPSNLTNIIVDQSIEDDIDYLRLTIDPKSKAVFSWEQVFVPIAR